LKDTRNEICGAGEVRDLNAATNQRPDANNQRLDVVETTRRRARRGDGHGARLRGAMADERARQFEMTNV
jgi:hypothetical protein